MKVLALVVSLSAAVFGKKGIWRSLALPVWLAASLSMTAGAQTVLGTVPTGGSPSGIAANPATNKVYVANSGSNTVTVIDGAANSTTTIPVGNAPSAVAVNPATNKVYVANSDSNTVTVIDGVTNTTATVSAGSNPIAVAVNPVTNKVYIANEGGNTVTVIDGATNTTATASAGSNPIAVAVNPVTNKVYVANEGGNTVTVIDGATNATATVSAGSHPRAIAVNPVTNMVYVANGGDDTVTVINGATKATATVSIGIAPYAIAVNPVTSKVYVANAGGTVTVIDGATNATTTLTVGGFLVAVAVNPLTNKIFVASSNASTVTVIDGASNTITTVGVGSSSRAIAVNPVTGKVYVTNFSVNTVTAIEEAANTAATVSVGIDPYPVAVNPVTNKVYVANFNGNTVTVIDGATNATATVSVGSHSQAIAVNPVMDKVYVANYGGNTVTVIDGATNATATVNVGSNPIAVAVNPVTNKVYVANFNGNTVMVIDGATNATATVSVGSNPRAVAVNPATGKVYVVNDRDNTVTVIDGATNETATVSVGSNPLVVAVNPRTNKVYVANFIGNTVTVIDGATNETATVSVGSNPIAVAVNPVMNKVYVTNFGDNTVTVIDGATNTTVTVSVGSMPTAVATNPVAGKVYVANQGDNTVTVIDGATNATTAAVAGDQPRTVAVNPVTGKAYVANGSSNTVTVIDAYGAQAVPMTITAAGSATVPAPYLSVAATPDTPYTTTDPAPSINVNVTTTYTGLGAYSTGPVPSSLYYWLDDNSVATWTVVAPGSALGSNPATFPVSLSGKAPGYYTLYLYAAYGNEGTSSGSGNGTGGSPEISNLAAYSFAVSPIATSTSVVADTNPQAANSQVTFTATVTPAATGAVATPTGTVNFYDGSTLLNPTPLALSRVNGSYIASYQTTFPSSLSHTIKAVYTTGDQNYYGSSGTMTQSILGVPTVTAVSPASGPVTGGTSVTISGSGFTSSATVMFGSTPAASVNQINGTILLVTSPAGAAGLVDITVTTSAGTSTASQWDRFTYVAAPTISGITPASGPLGGGTAVTITGTNFPANPTVTFGGIAAAFVAVLNPSTMAVVSPEATVAGAVDIRVTTPGGTSSISSADRFTYMGTQTITFANPGTVTYGTTPTLTATASSGLTVAFTSSTVGVCTITGTGTLTLLAAGTCTIVATQSGDATYSAAPAVTQSFAVDKNVSGAVTLSGLTRVYDGTTHSVTATTSPAGLTVNLTFNGSATAPTAAGSYTVVGTIDDARYSGSATGTLVIAKAPLAVTANAATMSYGGPLPSLSGALTGVAAGDGITATYTTNATTSSDVGGTYTVTATLNDPNNKLANYVVINNAAALTITQATAGLTLSGLSAIYDGAPHLPTVTTTPAGLNTSVTYNGSPAAPTAVGSYAVVATIANQPNYSGSAAGTLVIGQATLHASANDATRAYGAANPAFTGMVTGQQAGDTITASFITAAVASSPVGSYSIVPTLAGANLSNYTQTINNGTLTITRAGTVTTIGTSTGSLTPGQTATLSTAVASTTTGVPTGTVNFYDGATLLGTVALANGAATYNVANLSAGASHILSAVYGGDGNFAGSAASSTATIAVTALDFTLSLNGLGSQSVVPGSSVSYTFNLSPLYGSYAAPVSFAVSGLPTGATATFSPETVAASSGPQTVTLSVHAPAVVAVHHAERNTAMLALLLLPLWGVRRRRSFARLLYLLPLLLVGAGACMLTGCGAGNGYFGQAEKSYSLTVTATSGAIQRTGAVTLIVQ